MEIEFYPEHGGNIEKNPEDRVSVVIETLSVDDVDQMKAGVSYTKIKGFRDKFKDNSQDILKKIFNERVKAFRNLRCPITKKAIKTAKEFGASYCSIDLKTEILDVLQDVSQLSEEQVKNSVPPSIGA